MINRQKPLSLYSNSKNTMPFKKNSISGIFTNNISNKYINNNFIQHSLY